MTSPIEPAPAGQDDCPDGPWTDSDWTRRALCAETDPDAFFPEQGGTADDAKMVCAGCPVRWQCLSDALDRKEEFGIWGGLSVKERKPLTRGLPGKDHPRERRQAIGIALRRARRIYGTPVTRKTSREHEEDRAA